MTKDCNGVVHKWRHAKDYPILIVFFFVFSTYKLWDSNHQTGTIELAPGSSLNPCLWAESFVQNFFKKLILSQNCFAFEGELKTLLQLMSWNSGRGVKEKKEENFGTFFFSRRKKKNIFCWKKDRVFIFFLSFFFWEEHLFHNNNEEIQGTVVKLWRNCEPREKI